MLETEGGDTLLGSRQLATGAPEFRRKMERLTHPARKFDCARHNIVNVFLVPQTGAGATPADLGGTDYSGRRWRTRGTHLDRQRMDVGFELVLECVVDRPVLRHSTQPVEQSGGNPNPEVRFALGTRSGVPLMS